MFASREEAKQRYQQLVPDAQSEADAQSVQPSSPAQPSLMQRGRKIAGTAWARVTWVAEKMKPGEQKPVKKAQQLTWVDKAVDGTFLVVTSLAFLVFLIASLPHVAYFFASFEPQQSDGSVSDWWWFVAYLIAGAINITEFLLSIKFARELRNATRGLPLLQKIIPTFVTILQYWPFILIISGFSWAANLQHAREFHSDMLSLAESVSVSIPFMPYIKTWGDLNPYIVSAFPILNIAYTLMFDSSRNDEHSHLQPETTKAESITDLQPASVSENQVSLADLQREMMQGFQAMQEANLHAMQEMHRENLQVTVTTLQQLAGVKVTEPRLKAVGGTRAKTESKAVRKGSAYEEPIKQLLLKYPNITATEAGKRVGCSHVTAGTILKALRPVTVTQVDESETYRALSAFSFRKEAQPHCIVWERIEKRRRYDTGRKEAALMQLVEQHVIDRNDPRYSVIDAAAFASKNLYNAANYEYRQAFIHQGVYLNYNEVQKRMQSHEAYKALPAKVSQQILMVLDRNWKGFREGLEAYYEDQSKFLGRPKPPKYKHKTEGRNILVYTTQAISKRGLKRGLVQPSMLPIEVQTRQKDIDQVRIVPRSGFYIVEVVYEKEVKQAPVNPAYYAGIDIGMNNLVVLTSNKSGFRSVLVNGRPVKSVNQFYNKRKAELQKQLGHTGTTKRMERMTNKRNRRIDHYMHTASKRIIDLLVKEGIGVLCIGKNDAWKQEANMGKRNNQNFVQIPHARFIAMLTYKAELVGIRVKVTEESYTSKASLLDLNPLPVRDPNNGGEKHTFSGKRIKRGLYRASDGRLINADINGAGNTIRKVAPDAFGLRAVEDGKEMLASLVVHPVRLSFPSRS